MENKFLQYELWKACNNNCAFCTALKLKDVDKNKSLDNALQTICSAENIKYNKIGFIGGEFFDNQLDDLVIKEKFYELFSLCKKRILNKTLDNIYITSSLIFKLEKHFIPFLEYLKELNLLEYTMLCTSYDIKYRFKNKDQALLWKNNMLFLKDNYSALKIHTQIILTQFFIDAVLKNEFDILAFCKEFNTFIDYNEPQATFFYKTKNNMIKYLPDFFPTKKSFLEFVKRIVLKEKIINLNTFLLRDLHCDKLYYSKNGEIKCLENRHKKENFYAMLEDNENKMLGFIDSDLKMSDVIYMLVQDF